MSGSGAYAVALPDGKVLVAGGEPVVPDRPTAELFDPSSGTFALTGAPVAGTRGYANGDGTLEWPSPCLGRKHLLILRR